MNEHNERLQRGPTASTTGPRPSRLGSNKHDAHGRKVEAAVIRTLTVVNGEGRGVEVVRADESCDATRSLQWQEQQRRRNKTAATF